jgi:hypothetical protein
MRTRIGQTVAPKLKFPELAKVLTSEAVEIGVWKFFKK